MELIHIFPNGLEELCLLLLKSRFARFCFFIKYKNKTDIIEEHFEGIISERIFLKYISYSVDKLFLRTFLSSFVDAMESSFITDEIFTALFNYPKEQNREQIIISLSHKALSKQQLKKLCETNQCFECYFEYVISVYLSEITTKEDVREAIAMFLASPFAKLKSDLQNELKTIECTNPAKKALLDLLS